MRDFNQHRTERRAGILMAWLLMVAMLALPSGAFAAPTHIIPPKNGYSVQDDVKAGREAAAQVEQQLPILRDSGITNYVSDVGQRLVSAIPPEYQHPEFRYSFQVVNQREINAFALPGGYMFVNRGMIEAARNEGELAGVMAHELSHVALRHGTAQATKAQKYSVLGGIGAIAGAVIGGGLGSIVGQGSQLAIGTYFLKFSREYETQADVLGAQIMARAGYDPRDLANVFRTIQQQGGSGGPQFLSDHPNPANRLQRINQEAALIGPVRNPIQNTREFLSVKERLQGMGRAPSASEIAQGRPNNGGSQGSVQQNVSYPSTRYQTYTGGNLFRISVPDNWRQLGGDSSSITYAPDGAYGQIQGQSVFTHGVMVGLSNARGNNLRQSSDDFINSLLQGNQYLRAQGGYQRASIDGHNALALTLAGRSPQTGDNEIDTVVTTQTRDGNLFYMISVAPQRDYRAYQGTFQNVLRSIQLNDR